MEQHLEDTHSITVHRAHGHSCGDPNCTVHHNEEDDDSSVDDEDDDDDGASVDGFAYGPDSNGDYDQTMEESDVESDEDSDKDSVPPLAGAWCFFLFFLQICFFLPVSQ